jgi:hypothetical protein
MIAADVTPGSTLRAPIAVPVEIRADAGRAFRLAAAVGEDGMRFETAVPFEAGRLCEARFALPDGPFLVLPARLDGRDGEPADSLRFLEPPADARRALHRYVADRLELPS